MRPGSSSGKQSPLLVCRKIPEPLIVLAQGLDLRTSPALDLPGLLRPGENRSEDLQIPIDRRRGLRRPPLCYPAHLRPLEFLDSEKAHFGKLELSEFRDQGGASPLVALIGPGRFVRLD